MSAKMAADPNVPTQAMVQGFEELNELEMLGDQLTQTQLKLKVALSRYEDLYQYSEQILKTSEKDARESRERIAEKETLLKTSQAEQQRLSAAIGGLQASLQAKEEEIRNLRNSAGVLARVIDKNIQALADLTGFVENFSERIQAAESNPLVSKGARIMLEQLKQETENLRTVRSRLSSP